MFLFFLKIGDTANVPDSVMGLTFLAAGTSLPEAVSSVIVTNQGHGAMGISSSISSNTFDILLCLGIPWFLKAYFVPENPGQHWVRLLNWSNSKRNIFYNTFFALRSIDCSSFSWNKLFGNLTSFNVDRIIRSICTKQIQIGLENWSHMLVHVHCIFELCQCNWVECFLPSQFTHLSALNIYQRRIFCHFSLRTYFKCREVIFS